ncbi:MAG TPA: methionine--tRNA ligase [Abditibacteriaceae bacterium]|jgi:methionyl-tRNA synthetase
MAEKTFFITTPIYYINATPHIGHAYTTMAADALARFERLRGRRVYFLTGTDEHGAKVARAARDAGLSPQEHADTISAQFRQCWDALHISYDDYIRTTEPRHERVAQRIIQKLWDKGFLRLGSYSGWYSVPDETFFRPEDTVERDGEHYIAQPSEDQSRAPLEWVEEISHFFTLSTFQDDLIRYYEEHPETLQPQTRRNEVMAFLKSGLNDVSISRELDWGIPIPAGVPAAEKHSIYVWFEALMNYISAPGYLSEDPEQQRHFEGAWPCDVHLMSKDIFTRFHATLWPALLRALDLPMPKMLFAHGFWTVNGRKMSKRDPETIVEPIAFAREIADLAGCDFGTAVDALRFYCLREVTFGADGDFSPQGCLARYNSELANGLGNLVNRALSMLQQWDFNGVVPNASGQLGLMAAIPEAHNRVAEAYESLDFSTALAAVFEIVTLGNRTIEEQKPWTKIKEGDRESVATLLHELLLVCQWCAVALSPVMPHATARVLELLNIQKMLTWNEALGAEFLPPGHECRAPEPLFPRIPPKSLAGAAQNKKKESTMSDSSQASTQASASESAAPEAGVTSQREEVRSVPTDAGTVPAVGSVESSEQPAAEEKNTIEYADFAKVELRAAKILEAERVPKADKLLKLQVDLGSEKRQILAGIAQQFEPEALIGKTIVVVANLAPRKMRGLESQGMLLAASADADGPPSGLLTVDADVPPGSIIR